MQLYEKHRPTSLKELAGLGRQVETLLRWFNKPGWDRDAIWIQGSSGCGKTTLANILANMLADERDIFHVPGAECTAERVAEIKHTSQLSTWGVSGWKVFIIDEANAITPRAVQAWKDLLEPLRSRRLYVFTSARMIEDLFETGGENQQLSSRCKVITLKPDLYELSDHARRIAEQENLGGAEEEEYFRLIKECNGNMRAVFQRIESGHCLVVPKQHQPTPEPDAVFDMAQQLAILERARLCLSR